MAQEVTISECVTDGAFKLSRHEDERRRVALCEVHVIASTDPEHRNSLLTEGVYAVIEFLVVSAKFRDGRAVVDIRLPEAPAPESLPGAYAFVEAIRGLVQAHTLETDPHAAACNIVVSTQDQNRARESTIAYLISDGGGFSRGATYDLRDI